VGEPGVDGSLLALHNPLGEERVMPGQTTPCVICGKPTRRSRATCSPACRVKRRNSLEVVALRFWRRVEKSEACWRWTGPVRGNNGYGAFHYLGRPISAHQFSWALHCGPVPAGLCVLHRCDNPVCVNPAHLFLGTHADNMADRDAKGRLAHGERVGCSKLTDALVREMRRLRADGATETELALRFNVARSTAHRVVTGELWPHVAGLA
jgi:hypothetical protein